MIPFKGAMGEAACAFKEGSIGGREGERIGTIAKTQRR
jgi:hypothetical protein